MQAPMDSAAGINIDRPTSAPNILSSSSHIGELSRPSFTTQTLSSQTVPTSQTAMKTKAMQLGANKVPGDIALHILGEEATTSSAMEENPWGPDLIDVNADEDDWSMSKLVWNPEN